MRRLEATKREAPEVDRLAMEAAEVIFGLGSG